MRKHYSAGFKAQVVKEVLKEEKPLNEIASECGIHPNMVRQWRDKALAALPGVFSRKGDE
jgi:transposase-like protein